MADKFFEKWKSPWLWLHYIALTGIVFVAHHYSEFLEKGVVNNEPNAWIYLFIYYVVWISMGDQLIHYIFGKYFGWKD